MSALWRLMVSVFALQLLAGMVLLVLVQLLKAEEVDEVDRIIARIVRAAVVVGVCIWQWYVLWDVLPLVAVL